MPEPRSPWRWTRSNRWWRSPRTVSKFANRSSARNRGELLRGAFRSEQQRRSREDTRHQAAARCAPSSSTRGRRDRHARKPPLPTQRPATIASAASMLVTFEVAGQEFALELASVQEILPAPAVVVAVPRAEALVVGVTSLRDRLLPLLSLRGLLGFPPAPAADGREKVVVMKIGGAQVGLVADRARAILAAPRVEHRPHSVGARGAHRRRSAPQSHLSRRARSQADIDPHARATIPGGRHAAARSRTERKLAGDARRPCSKQEQRQFLVFRLGNDEFGAADRRRRRSRRSAGADHPLAEDAEIPRGRREPSRRRAARRRPTPPFRHAGIERGRAAGASSSYGPTATARA